MTATSNFLPTTLSSGDAVSESSLPTQLGASVFASGLKFPVASTELEAFGFKFSDGGAHISRTIMSVELASTLALVPKGSSADVYRSSVIDRNILGKATVSTRQKSFRHLRELYALDESVPIFALLRTLKVVDPNSQSLLALQVAWARDPLFRATTQSVMATGIGHTVTSSDLAEAIHLTFPGQYSELNCAKIARNAASSWTQSGHLSGRTGKLRSKVTASPAAVTMALFLGSIAGYGGIRAFSNPWIHLLDLSEDGARTASQLAHKAGLLNLRAVGEVIELTFPMLDSLRAVTS
jgi:hypothetical protein